MKNNLEKWERIIEEMRSSRIRQKKWCQENGINYSTMRGWVRKINKLKARNSLTGSTSETQENICSWVKIEKPALEPAIEGGTIKKTKQIQLQITKISILVDDNQTTTLLKEILSQC